MLEKEETEQLFREQAERMHRLATTMLHDEEEARDAVSEIFERLTNGAIRLPAEKPESYLFVCLRNLCLDQIRKLSLRERIERHLTMESPSLTPVASEEQLLMEMMEYAEEMMTSRCDSTKDCPNVISPNNSASVRWLSTNTWHTHCNCSDNNLIRKKNERGQDGKAA